MSLFPNQRRRVSLYMCPFVHLLSVLTFIPDIRSPNDSMVVPRAFLIILLRFASSAVSSYILYPSLMSIMQGRVNPFSIFSKQRCCNEYNVKEVIKHVHEFTSQRQYKRISSRSAGRFVGALLSLLVTASACRVVTSCPSFKSCFSLSVAACRVP